MRLRESREFTLRLYGVRGEAVEREFCQTLEKAGIRTEVLGWMPYRNFVRSLSEVTVAICPLCDSNAFSRGKSFGKVLACMAAPTPMVLSSAADYPLFYSHGHNGMLVDGNNSTQWAECVVSLLDSAEQRNRISEQAARDYEARLTTATAAQLMATFLRSLR
jgi:glycosyltransferase involved in cell wall biosynthesis